MFHIVNLDKVKVQNLDQDLLQLEHFMLEIYKITSFQLILHTSVLEITYAC